MSVVYCPRTHAILRPSPASLWRDARPGINVAVGTDSCASSPDLNLVDDLRLLRKIAPDLPAEQNLARGHYPRGEGLGEQCQLGSLTPGKAGDVIAFEVDSETRWRKFCGSGVPVERLI